MQLKKLAVIGNACFWLTLLFQVWRPARSIHQHVLGTIVILGLVAVIFNLAWSIQFLVTMRKKTNASVTEKKSSVNKTTVLLLNSFNVLSFATQIILLSTKYL